MSISFPNVPNLPGVPALARQIAGVVTRLSAGSAIIGNLLAQASQSSNIWGVFDSSNNKVLAPDTILALDFIEEWRISSYPVQPNSFSSYNRVQTPFEVALVMRKAGTTSERKRFINQIVAMRLTTTLYTIITPELIYTSLSFARWSQRRKEAEGAFTVEVEMIFEKINSGTAAYSTTQNAAAPSALPNAAQGTVSSSPTPATVKSQITGAPP